MNAWIRQRLRELAQSGQLAAVPPEVAGQTAAVPPDSMDGQGRPEPYRPGRPAAVTSPP